MNNFFSRRKFLKLSALGGSVLGFAGSSLKSERDRILEKIEMIASAPERKGNSVIGLKVLPIKQVKVGVIGLGNRGADHVELINALCPDKASITAICDIQQVKIDGALDIINKSNSGQKPAVYTGSTDAWKEMIKRDDIDLITIATPWEDHVPMALAAMQAGKHVATEVPAAYTLEDCWLLVDTAEETQRNCMMLENVCYGDEELWVLNMAQEGVFGTLTYGEAAYIHDLRELMFSNTYYFNKWRIRHHEVRDGNLYPTHGLGPVAQYMDILRGDNFNTLVSMSTLQAGLTEYSKTLPAGDEFYNHTKYVHGDMNNTLIKTEKGKIILVQHDVVSPRPYSRINALAGTKAYHEGYPSRLSINGKGHNWLKEEEYKDYRERYNHPLWNKLKSEIAKYGGHGGMDFVMMYRLIHAFNKGWHLDMDVYDAAAWSAVTPLSKQSIDMGNAPIKFPDFTRGEWKESRPLGIRVNL